MTTFPDLGHLIEPLARQLFGEPDLRFSRGSELRFGATASFMIDVKRGCWFDYERGRGGDVYALLRERFGCTSERQCLEWVEREGRIGNGGAASMSPEDRHAFEEAEARKIIDDGIEEEDGPPLSEELPPPAGDSKVEIGDGAEGESEPEPELEPEPEPHSLHRKTQ